MDNLQTITVSVDSSYNHGLAACAYYIKHEKFVVKDSEFMGEMPNSTMAELEGMVRAVTRMKLEIRDRDIKRVYITCDCKYALNNILSRCKLLNTFDEVILQHIDAHSGKYSPRQFVNDWCDKESRLCLNNHLKNETI